MNRGEVLRLMAEVGAGQDDIMPISYDGVVDVFERFAAAMYAKGAADMKERAAKECATEADGWRGVNSDGRSPYADHKLEACEECAVAIRALPITPKNTEGGQA